MSCKACDPTLFPRGTRRGEGHASVRFDDLRMAVALDGEPLLDCYEVDCDQAMAWCYRRPLQKCKQCGVGCEAYIVRGNLSIAQNNRVRLGPGLQPL